MFTKLQKMYIEFDLQDGPNLFLQKRSFGDIQTTRVGRYWQLQKRYYRSRRYRYGLVGYGVRESKGGGILDD